MMKLDEFINQTILDIQKIRDEPITLSFNLSVGPGFSSHDENSVSEHIEVTRAQLGFNIIVNDE